MLILASSHTTFDASKTIKVSLNIVASSSGYKQSPGYINFKLCIYKMTKDKGYELFQAVDMDGVVKKINISDNGRTITIVSASNDAGIDHITKYVQRGSQYVLTN